MRRLSVVIGLTALVAAIAIGIFIAFREQRRPEVRWEYKLVHLSSQESVGTLMAGDEEEQFNALGKDGWEIVGVYPKVQHSDTVSACALFKRQGK